MIGDCWRARHTRVLRAEILTLNQDDMERTSGNRSKTEAVTPYRLLCRSSQFSTHFTNCISISAFLWGTRSVDSGATISDCGPSARLNVHWNSKDWTPRCWQGFFSSAGSNISGLACNWSAISDGSIATTIGTRAFIFLLTIALSWSLANPPSTSRTDVSFYFSLPC